MEKLLSNVERIIVHGGFISHQDERVACGIAFMAGADCPIERRDPTIEELEDPNVLVLDVGGQWYPGRLNFDHHQLVAKEGETPDCAYSLLARHLGVEDAMQALYAWYDTGRWLDVTGPYTTAEHYGAKWESIAGFMGPGESITARKWAADADFRAQTSREYAEAWATEVEAFEVLKDVPEVTEVGGLRVLWTQDITDPRLRMVSGALAKRYSAKVVVGKDDRGGGLSLMRVGNGGIDFRRVADDPRVGFVHKESGFICKTNADVTSLEDAIDLIEKSIG